MRAIVVKSDAKSLKLIMEIAKHMGGEVAKIDDDQLEDFYFWRDDEGSKNWQNSQS
jgi:hypothetical protein